ncbi:aldehyde dehydrogenase family protein [Telluribacter humicola]|uniref:aldehyde dehydrogenase family protein n=1 Tax=Telluribacter humicola TaxID=1720261 RepID=UPI001A96ECBD|nr:aldehyde dehydrogenase family protein [Telluribacter humicola]
MQIINHMYIDGEFVSPHGTATLDITSPVSQELLGKVSLGDEVDTQRAIAAAKAAFTTFSRTTRDERIQYLRQMLEAVTKRKEDLIDVMVLEYGAPIQFACASAQNALDAIRTNVDILEVYAFEQRVGRSTVQQTPVGVVGIITPWNASNGFICSKLSTALAAGCTAVIKPSELSALQTQLISECLHEAGLPKGIFNIVNGLGHVVGAEIVRHPDVAKISFTGSTVTGKTIIREGAATMKRVTLELGGKSPNILLDDADLSKAIPLSVAGAFMNSGQACIAATRLLVPQHKLEEIKPLLIEAESGIKVGNPQEEDTNIGPMVSQKQFQRVQDYILKGIAEGAEILIGGLEKPEGLEAGNFVKPTVFIHVNNSMRIAQEEIFGPVLSVITYRTEEEAIQLANDSSYGLAAYVQSSNQERALQIATRLDAGRVSLNALTHDPMAPFGGFKQSGLGREYGVFDLEAYLEPKAILEVENA